MNRQKLHYFADWFAIFIFLFISFCTTVSNLLWWKVTYIAPVPISLALCLLFVNHVSIKQCFQTKEKEFFLLCIGVLLSGINIIIIKSNIGAFFTITNFLLILYLADKHIVFDKIQIGVIAFSSFLILFYWLFINKEVYENIFANPNRASLYIFIHFCVFLCCGVYLLSSTFSFPVWYYHIGLFVIAFITAMRIQSLQCRGILLAITVWTITYYLLPKKNYTISLIIGASLFMPIVYVLLWKSGLVDSLIVFGKRFASGRDIIWYEFFNAFIKYPITGIGSDFDRTVPNLYLKEVHHALLDLLFVHGIPVFLIVLYLLYKRIQEVITCSSVLVRAVCLASIYGIITAGSFENFYIVSPYNALFLVILVIPHISVWNR